MNWTGGNLQRHSKNKNNAAVERQKSYFAKVRVQKGNSALVRQWNRSSPPKASTTLLTKKRRKANSSHSPRARAWSLVDQAYNGFGAVNHPSSKRSEVLVKIGERAFESQLGTDAATPSVVPRPISDSSEPMLLDEFDQKSTVRELCEANSPFQSPTTNSNDVPHDLVSPKTRDQSDTESSTQWQVSHSLFGVSTNVPSSVSDGSQTNEECTQSSPNIGDTFEEANQGMAREAIPERSPSRFESSATATFGSHHGFTSLNHESTSNYAWRRFIQDDQAAVYGIVGSKEIVAPQSVAKLLVRSVSPLSSHFDRTNIRTEPVQSADSWSSTQESSCPTRFACLPEIGRSKRSGGEASKVNQKARNDEDEAWMRFVLGSGDAEGDESIM